ncbi:sugar phosphate isomerase/epimerase family protein [Halogeometricum luteum]|uniref:Sugar phosphate isomerase/epimerase n=1 Tax=Halogeometricum luteum TaxID=2950537 RepID=A0ABU2G2Z2_9EURY|nr:sugar phosphate isomerase/epimerase [Halogeometricum sp. S3BR5-2]MDS0295142.1 sugar phosphate isomerase/epimerase [Halogeometricum sp. S3BR5-2]
MERTPRPAIQLYSVREASDPLPEVIRRVAEAGFEGVEFADRFFEADADAVAEALSETGVVPVAAHADLPTIEAALDGGGDLFERLETVGCDRVVVPHVPANHFRTRWAVRAFSYRIADVAHELDAHDVDLGYHTIRHDLYPMVPRAVGSLFEKTPLPHALADAGARGLARLRAADPRFDASEIPSDSGYWNLIARTAPDDLFFEVDVGEVTAAGFDPAAAVELASGRVPLVHIRDVAPTGRFGAFESADPGRGVVDFASVARAARESGTEWLVYEHDDPADAYGTVCEGANLLSDLVGDPSDGSSGDESTDDAATVGSAD